MRRANFGSRFCLLSLSLGIAACTGDKGDEETGSTGGVESTEAEMPSTGAMDSESAGSQATEATEAMTTTGGTETGEALDERCECSGASACNQTLCPPVKWMDEDGDGELDAEYVDAFMTASTCAIEALRDGQAGRISWDYYAFGGQYNEDGVHKLLGDGFAWQTHGGDSDLCSYTVDPIDIGVLKPTQFFADCLAETDASSRFSCVRSPSSGTTATCQAGEQNCDGV